MSRPPPKTAALPGGPARSEPCRVPAAPQQPPSPAAQSPAAVPGSPQLVTVTIVAAMTATIAACMSRIARRTSSAAH